jgi:aspartate-semialdehyde dehydrogenase
LLERSGDGPMPSLRLVQAPVFHGYSFSIWMQFDADAPDIDQIETLLASENMEVRGNGAEPPNNIGMAGQNGVSVGAITRDRNNARAVWIWAVADNLRLAAQNAVLVAREII